MADDEREAFLTTKRGQNYNISNEMAERSGRHGLFTSYPPLAIGDNSVYQQKKPRVNRDAENPKEVLIDPPNIITNPVKQGASIDSVLFHPPGYNAVGEPYEPPVASLVRREDREAQVQAGNEKRFKLQNHVKFKNYQASYEHMTDFTDIQKNYRCEENPREVMSMPRNIQTNPIKKGQLGLQVTFGGTVPYMEDDYNRPKQFARLEREYHDSKLQDKPFSQRAKKTDTFNSHKKILMEDIPIPHRAPKPKTAPPVEHDKPFKPSNPPKRGYNKTIAKFPNYIPDPKKPVTRRVPVEGEDEKGKFKPTHNAKSRPTPSVATNLRNIKQSFPSVFRK